MRDCLSLDEVPLPDLSAERRRHPGDTLVVIRTEYAGVQYPDALQARGLYQVRPRLPYVPGMDVVGIVTGVPPPRPAAAAARRVRPGDRVVATLLGAGGTGGLAEVVVVPLKNVFRVPDRSARTLFREGGGGGDDAVGLSSPRDGAVFANIGRNYFAAYHSLVEVGAIDPDAETNEDTVVLVTGASGGVGMATIELAKAMGCTVVAGVGGPSKAPGPESVGADAVYCYGRTKTERKAFRKAVTGFCRQLQRQQRRRGTGPAGVDLVVDVVMGDLFGDALVGCLKPLGTIALVGFAAGQRTIRPGILLVKEARVAGSLWSSVAAEAREDDDDDNENRYARMVRRILGYLADGRISGRVGRLVPVSRFVEAFEVFEDNRGRGNTVVSFVDDENDERPRSRL